MSKKIIIIAGPNGAGKTTFARSFLPEEAQCTRFINADLIAAGLSPFAPEAEALKAGRLMLEEIAGCVRRGESFAFETTLAGFSYLARIRQWRAQGYHVSLFSFACLMPRRRLRVSPSGSAKAGTIFRQR
jgi:predicted ABC-type ATPase